MQIDDSDKCLLCLNVVKETRRVFVVTFVTHGFILSIRILLCLILIVLHQLKSITIVVDACYLSDDFEFVNLLLHFFNGFPTVHK